MQGQSQISGILVRSTEEMPLDSSFAISDIEIDSIFNSTIHLNNSDTSYDFLMGDHFNGNLNSCDFYEELYSLTDPKEGKRNLRWDYFNFDYHVFDVDTEHYVDEFGDVRYFGIKGYQRSYFDSAIISVKQIFINAQEIVIPDSIFLRGAESKEWIPVIDYAWYRYANYNRNFLYSENIVFNYDYAIKELCANEKKEKGRLIEFNMDARYLEKEKSQLFIDSLTTNFKWNRGFFKYPTTSLLSKCNVSKISFLKSDYNKKERKLIRRRLKKFNPVFN